MQCGAINGAEARTCCLCDTRLSPSGPSVSVSASAQKKSGHNLAVGSDWRHEVSQKIEDYQLRHGRVLKGSSEPQCSVADSILPKPEEPNADTELQAFEAPPATITKRRFRPARVERLEINVEQGAFDFSGAETQLARNRAVTASESPAPSVASLLERRRAGALDVAFLLSAYGAFLTLFHALGGRLALTRLDALITAATLGLLYAQYVTLFTYFAGATPGMMLRGLRVVSSDGLNPSPRQLLWRSVGYLISAGTMMLGFLWAMWDEDQLSWHDRISQTCITPEIVPPSKACIEPSPSR